MKRSPVEVSMTMVTIKPTDTQIWAQGLGQAGPRAAQEREQEIARVLRALDEALIEDDRAEILAQFDGAVIVLAKAQRWHEGLAAAREVFAAVARWEKFDAAPYALTVAQFAHNYAIELQQARVFEAAEDLYREASSIFETYGDVTRQMRTVHQLGRVLQEQCKYEEGLEAYQISLRCARELEDDGLVGRNLFQLGQVRQLMGDLVQSESLYDEALTLAQSRMDTRIMGATAHQLGLIAQTRRDFGQATQWFQMALEYAREIDDVRGIAAALHQLGMLAHAQGAIADAEELYRASLSGTTLLDDSAEAAPTLYQLAQAALTRGDFVGANQYARQSLTLLQAQGVVAGIRRVKKLICYLSESAGLTES